MGGVDQRPAAGTLLCEHSPRCDGGGCLRSLRHLFRDDRGASLRVGKWWRQLDVDCEQFAGGVVRRSPNPVTAILSSRPETDG